MNRRHITLLGAVCLIGLNFFADAHADERKLKVGFIYIGSIAGDPWTASNEEGRQAAAKALPWLDSNYVESVSDADLESYIDQMVAQGDKVIFTMSVSYMDGSLAAAARYPEVLFFNSSGYRHGPNLATFQADMYQCAYLEGMLAGALSKTGKAGSSNSFPNPDTARSGSAFALGLRAVNPKAVVTNLWLNTWYDPPAEKEAAETLIAQGADFLCSLDSPTVAEVAQAHHVQSNFYGGYGYSVAPDSIVTGHVYDWCPTITGLLQKVHNGIYTAKNLDKVDLWLRLGDNAIKMAYKPGLTINPEYIPALRAVIVDDGNGGKISAYDLFLLRLTQMSQNPPQFEPFTGPLVDATGKTQVPAGQTASHSQLSSMTWRLPNVIGSWPLTH